MGVLANLEPASVFHYFEEICSIPHTSHHEKALSDYCVQFAKAHGLACRQDEMGNVLIKAPATPGYENQPALILQGHLDMVLAQEEGLGRDMIREPVHLVLEGSILRADRTTLGADNAVGLCHMLALMDADDLRHPPMELLFTVCEEEGLQGIQAFDLSQLRARRMINMDMGDPDCMVIGSAGSAKLTVSRPCRHASCHDAGLEISISGLRGGHSGLLAGKNHISALHLAGRVLGKLCDVQPVRLIQLESDGGSGIPRSALLRVAVPDKDAAMTLLRGVGSDLPLQEWLFEKMMPIEDQFTKEDIRIGNRLALLEMISTGTTSYSDMYFHTFRFKFPLRLCVCRIRANGSACRCPPPRVNFLRLPVA